MTLQLPFDGTWSGGAAHVRVRSRVTVRMSVPELNMPEEAEMPDEASVIEIVDRNTLRDDDGTIIRRSRLMRTASFRNPVSRRT